MTSINQTKRFSKRKYSTPYRSSPSVLVRTSKRCMYSLAKRFRYKMLVCRSCHRCLHFRPPTTNSLERSNTLEMPERDKMALESTFYKKKTRWIATPDEAFWECSCVFWAHDESQRRLEIRAWRTTEREHGSPRACQERRPRELYVWLKISMMTCVKACWRRPTDLGPIASIRIFFADVQVWH